MIAPAQGDSMMSPMVTAPRWTVRERAMRWQAVGRYRTLWVFSGTASLMLLLVALLHALSPLEHALFAGPAISDEPFWTLMVVLSLPHTIIATLFMSTSKRWAANRGRLLAAALLGLGIAGLFYAMGGLEKGWRADLVILYFLAHVYRDEWSFYRHHCGKDLSAFRSWLLPAALYSVMLAVWWTVYVVITKDPVRSICDDADHCLLAGHGKVAIWLPLFAILCVVAQYCLRRFVREGNASFKTLLQRDAPLYWVYALIPLIAVGCVALGARLYSVILLHVIGWWLFATMGYARTRQPVNAGASTWYWLRNTQTGFQALHAGLVISFCGLMVYVHHANSQGTLIAWALSHAPFYYFTIMHVTMSFTRAPH
jgi:hypothetical protein